MSGSIQPAGESPRGKGRPSRSKLDDVPCAPMDREKLARLLRDAHRIGHRDDPRSIYGRQADALIAAGLRLPRAVQPDETLAWAVVGEGGDVRSISSTLSRKHIDKWPLGPDERIVRVAIRRVEDEA